MVKLNYLLDRDWETFFLMNNEMDAVGSSTTFGAFSDISEINATADTGACDLEFVVVTT